MTFDPNTALFEKLMVRRYGDDYQGASMGTEALHCNRCGYDGMPTVAHFGPNYPHAAAAFCPNCMDDYGALHIKWLPKDPDKKRKAKISAGLRWQVFERDGFRCVYCNRHAKQLEPGEYLHADHVIAESAGGETALENLTTSCSTCNVGKSDRVLTGAD